MTKRLPGIVAWLLIASASIHAFDMDELRARYTITSWTEKDGLHSSFIRAIAQDRTGYLWLGTYTGLVRFDGVRFVVWKPQDGRSLPSDDISALLIARDGSLWVGCFNGVAHLVHGRLVTNATAPDGFFQGYISDLLEDRTGAIWASYPDGVARFDGSRWSTIGIEYGLPKSPGLSLLEDDKGTIWASTSAGIYFKTRLDPRFRPLPEFFDVVQNMIQAPDGKLITTDRTHLISELGRRESDLYRDPERREGTQLMVGHDGNLWVGTRGSGLVRIRVADGRRIIDRVDRREGLSADTVLSLLQDREGSIWVGTPFGLNRLSENAVIPLPAIRGLSGFFKSVTTSVDGDIWATTEDSLVHFSGQSQTIYDWKTIRPNHSLIALYEDPETRILWISTNAGLVRFMSGTFSSFPLPGDLQLKRIRSITTDKQGRLWLCDTYGGVFRSTDRSLHTFQKIVTPAPASRALTARDGRVWLGLVNGTVGLYEGGRLNVFSVAEGLAGGIFSAIHEDRTGTIWVATYGGLSRFERDHFVTLKSHAQFPWTGPVSIADDAEGYLWLGVQGLGLVRLGIGEFNIAARDTLHKLRFRIYGMSEGLRASPVVRAGQQWAPGPNGTLWFLTGNGFAVVDPPKLHEAPSSDPLIIEDITTDTDTFSPVPGLRMPPRTSKLQIDYTLLSLKPRSQVNFQYKLEGLDDAWVEAGSRRQAFYTNVPPGHYRFIVKTDNGDASAEWPFLIQPTFYQTPWFAIALSGCGGFGVWGLWRLRLSHIRARLALVWDERTRLGREIHDTLLQGLVGVAVQAKVISEQVSSSPDVAKERLDRLRKLVEQSICETRESIWDLRSPTLRTRDLVTALRQASEAITIDNAVRVEFRLTGKPYDFTTRIEEQMLRVGQEALINAVRHADPGRVIIELKYSQEAVRLRIADDGKGFDVDNPGLQGSGHWGLAGMRERARQIGAELRIVSTPGTGTELELTVPAAIAEGADNGVRRRSGRRSRPFPQSGPSRTTSHR